MLKFCNCLTYRSGDETMIEKYKVKLGDKIHNTYGQKWSDAEVKDKTKEILDVVLKCCEKKDAVRIHTNDIYKYIYIIYWFLLFRELCFTVNADCYHTAAIGVE